MTRVGEQAKLAGRHGRGQGAGLRWRGCPVLFTGEDPHVGADLVEQHPTAERKGTIFFISRQNQRASATCDARPLSR